MKKINNYLLLFYFLITIPQVLSAAEDVNHEKLTYKVILISGNDVPSHLVKNSVVKIRDILTKEGSIIENYLPAFNEGINYNNCINRECVNELREVFPDRIVIIIFIKAEGLKIGQKRISRYLVEDIIETRYSIQIITTDYLKKKYDLTFKKSLLVAGKLGNEAELIGVRIAEFYSGKKPVEKPVVSDNKIEDKHELKKAEIK